MKHIIKLIAVLLATSALLLGCSSEKLGAGPGGEISCREYNAMSLPAKEMMQGKPNKEKDDVVKRMLVAHGYSTSDSTVDKAHIAINMYCRVDGSGNYPPGPIEDGIIWDD